MFDIVSPVIIWMSEISRYKKELRHPQPHPNNQIMISLFCWYGFLILYTVCSEYLVACLTDEPVVQDFFDVLELTFTMWALGPKCCTRSILPFEVMFSSLCWIR